MTQEECRCLRCGVPCRVDPKPGSTATILRLSEKPKGLCINCCVHDTLRQLYPINLQLARSGPKNLVYPDIQRMFFDVCVIAGTDARFEDINWQIVIANWDLPFPTKIKRTATNPVTQEELDREKLEGEKERSKSWKPPLTEQEKRAKRRAELDWEERERQSEL